MLRLRCLQLNSPGELSRDFRVSKSPGSRLQVAGQAHGAIADPHEPAHLKSDRAPDTAYLAIPSFMQDHTEIRVAAVSRLLDDTVETSRSVFQHHSVQQLF